MNFLKKNHDFKQKIKMMNKQIIKITLSLLFIVASFTSCVDDKDFDTPQVQDQDNDISNTPFITVKNSVNSQYTYGVPASLIYTYPENSTAVIAAYVISDDTSGNFYKKLIVQDNYENPAAGLQIEINEGALHATYNKGRRIYIKLAGLSVGYYDGAQGPSSTNFENRSNPTDNVPGVYKLGILDADLSIGRIPQTMYKTIISRSSTTEAIVPQVITTDDFNDSNMNTLIKMIDMQFEIGEINSEKTFANESNDSFDGERKLLSCDTEAVFNLMTSTFSNFKSLSLPAERGDLEGVLVKNYREVDPVIVLNKYEDIDFNSTDRCDPAVLVQIFYEDFNDFSDWTNYSVTGSNTWQSDATHGNPDYCAKMTGYQNGANQDWLITPAIDFSTTTDHILTFQTASNYSGPDLEIFVSNDYVSGDNPNSSATWTPVSANFSSGGWEWTNSGEIDLSSFDGSSNVFVGFKFTSTASASATHEIDNVIVGYVQ